jgi:phosphatidylinositol alpha-1,6-mannosyltransferase
MWTAGQLIARGDIDAVFCDSWKSIELLARTPVPVAVMAHGMEFLAAGSERKRRRIARAFSKARTVIANSRFTADLARPYLPAPTHLSIVHPPIHPQPAPSAAAVQRLSALTQDARPLLAGLARLEPRKGFDRVIQALPSLARRFPRIKLVLGGTGSDAGRLETLAREAGVADRLHLLGRIGADDKAALLSCADLFVMPTRREGSSVEGFGIVYAEAAWYGVPSLAGAEGGGGEAVRDGETGRVVAGEHREAVEAAIEELLADDVRRKAMGAAARNHVLRSGTWQTTLQRYLDGTLRSCPRNGT